MTDFEKLIQFIIPKVIMSRIDSHSQEEQVIDLLADNCFCERGNKSAAKNDGNGASTDGWPTSSHNSPEITCSPSPCVFDPIDAAQDSENCLRPDRNVSRSPSPSTPGSSGTFDWSPRTRRRGSPSSRRGSACSGYEQYQRSLLEVPMVMDYGDASSDDLSSEWDSDVSEVPRTKTDVCGELWEYSVRQQSEMKIFYTLRQTTTLEEIKKRKWGWIGYPEKSTR
ncbi:hypothetical protein HHI36_011579 [Cryptolaemus montrouzieri]|uniref:Uncharacterized protein n=1 Tax=Cryptolaemus montrouzieri TaxID=559131 RepID=A0ABD2MMH9_9CUCU